jgi:serine O-acetyltransferase
MADEPLGDGAPGLGEELELTTPRLSFTALVWSDYLASRGDRVEPTWRSALVYVARLALNPSLQFAFLLRLAQKGPQPLMYPVRWLQVVLFSSEIYWFKGRDGITLGPGVSFPHPIGVIIGPGVRIGTGVTIYNNSSIGSDRHWTPGEGAHRVPCIGDRAVIYPYTTIQGPWRIGHDAVVGLRVILDEDVPAGALKTITQLRRRGEWRGESRQARSPRSATSSSE